MSQLMNHSVKSKESITWYYLFWTFYVECAPFHWNETINDFIDKSDRIFYSVISLHLILLGKLHGPKARTLDLKKKSIRIHLQKSSVNTQSSTIHFISAPLFPNNFRKIFSLQCTVCVSQCIELYVSRW